MKRQYADYVAADVLIDNIGFYADPFASAPLLLKGKNMIHEVATKTVKVAI